MLTQMYRRQGSFQIYNSLTLVSILCLGILAIVSLITVKYSVSLTNPEQVVEVQKVPESDTSSQKKEEQSSQSEKKTSASQEKSNCRVSNKYPDKITQWCNLITKQAKKNGLDPDLVAALIWQESGGNPQAYSKSGAVGLMQVMPRDGLAASFRCVNGPCFANRPSMSELYDPTFNVKYGTNMLGNLVKSKGSVREALFKYGPSGGGYYYADKVLGIYGRYKK